MTNIDADNKVQEVEPLFSKQRVYKELLITTSVGIFIGFLSPFGMDRVPLYFSIAYWIVACICGYLVYKPCIYFGERWLSRTIKKKWVRVAISSIFASAIMSCVVPVLGWLFFDMPISIADQFITVFPKAIVIGGVITVFTSVRELVDNQKQELQIREEQSAKHQEQEANQSDKLLEKFMTLLPIEKRGDLYCLEMSDHYLKVYTDRGHCLILMRFKDALEMLAEFPGLQTHRSWWVAKDAIAAVRRDGRKISLRLINDVDVPVSRTYTDSLKAHDIH